MRIDDARAAVEMDGLRRQMERLSREILGDERQKFDLEKMIGAVHAREMVRLTGRKQEDICSDLYKHLILMLKQSADEMGAKIAEMGFEV